MADQNTAVKISLLFKDTSNDNYFTKYSSHILATFIILFIIIGLITYYKIKGELGSYKYRKDSKTGKLLWPTEKCKPHILPIAGHISRSPGETTDEATFRNFEECVESMVKDKNNEYIASIDLQITWNFYSCFLSKISNFLKIQLYLLQSILIHNAVFFDLLK